MSRKIAIGLVAVLMLTGCTGVSKKPKRMACPYTGMVRHVVLLKFKDGTSPDQIKAIEEAFRALPGKIPQVMAFEWGTDISPEKLAQGYTHCYFLTFENAAARDAYLPHPDHKAFGQLLGPHLDKVLVIDYVAKR
jgi:hypothetical protein